MEDEQMVKAGGKGNGNLTNMAGPVLRGGEIAQAAIDAIKRDNPGKEIAIEDHRAYVRIEADGGCVIRRETMEDILGRPFEMPELEVNLTAFSGQIETADKYVRFYFKTQQS